MKKNQPAFSLSESIAALDKIPRHVAIIMDGNGRWASQQGKSRAAGHRAGAKVVEKIIDIAQAVGIEVLSVFAFSSENWLRPESEVDALMKLFLKGLKEQMPKLAKRNVVFRVIGDRTRFSRTLQKYMVDAEENSRHHTGLNFVFAANYGGRWDIVQAAQSLAREVEAGVLKPDAIDETVFTRYLSLADLPAPDLFIRTSGEIRISNFFLWQLAYTELYFTDILWPDFNEQAFFDALKNYANRKRRFGKAEED